MALDFTPVISNPYCSYETSEVRRTVEEIERFRERCNELVADLHQQMIPDIDVGEFSQGLDDLFSDTLDASKHLAEQALEDRSGGEKWKGSGRG